MSERVHSTQEALALLADRGQDTTARVLRNIEKQLDLRVHRGTNGAGGASGASGAGGPDSDDGGQRLYSNADLDLLERVLVLQKAGLHLVEIRGILIEHDHYLLEFHVASLRRAWELLGAIQSEWQSPAA